MLETVVQAHAANWEASSVLKKIPNFPLYFREQDFF